MSARAGIAALLLAGMAVPAAANTRCTSSRDSVKCSQPATCNGTILAWPKTRAAYTPSSAVIVKCAGPTCRTTAAPMNNTAMFTRKRRATSSKPSNQTVSPEI